MWLRICVRNDCRCAYSRRWFRAASIYPIAEAFHLAQQYYDVVDKMREFNNGQITSNPEREYELRVKAGFILQTIPAAKHALVDEGAVLEDPEPKLVPANWPELPPVPEPVFAKTRLRLQLRRTEQSTPEA